MAGGDQDPIGTVTSVLSPIASQTTVVSDLTSDLTGDSTASGSGLTEAVSGSIDAVSEPGVLFGSGTTDATSSGASGGSGSASSGDASSGSAKSSNRGSPRTKFDRLPRRYETLLERIESGRHVRANIARLRALLASASPELRARVLRLIRLEIRRLERGGLTGRERAAAQRLDRLLTTLQRACLAAGYAVVGVAGAARKPSKRYGDSKRNKRNRRSGRRSTLRLCLRRASAGERARRGAHRRPNPSAAFSIGPLVLAAPHGRTRRPGRTRGWRNAECCASLARARGGRSSAGNAGCRRGRPPRPRRRPRHRVVDSSCSSLRTAGLEHVKQGVGGAPGGPDAPPFGLASGYPSQSNAFVNVEGPPTIGSRRLLSLRSMVSSVPGAGRIV
jgi:hypothetical protein